MRLNSAGNFVEAHSSSRLLSFLDKDLVVIADMYTYSKGSLVPIWDKNWVCFDNFGLQTRSPMDIRWELKGSHDCYNRTIQVSGMSCSALRSLGGGG